MNEFRRGTTVAATVLSVIFAAGIPIGVVHEHGWPFALAIVAIGLVAIWGSRLGLIGIHRHVFLKGRLQERATDTDFI